MDTASKTDRDKMKEEVKAELKAEEAAALKAEDDKIAADKEKAAILRAEREEREDTELQKQLEMDAPWAEASLMDIPVNIREDLERREMTPRWVSKSLFDKRVMEGWSQVMVDDKPYTMGKDIRGDGGVGESHANMREMILMELPNHRVEKRREHYRKLSELQVKQNAEQDGSIGIGDGSLSDEVKRLVELELARRTKE